MMCIACTAPPRGLVLYIIVKTLSGIVQPLSDI